MDDSKKPTISSIVSQWRGQASLTSLKMPVRGHWIPFWMVLYDIWTAQTDCTTNCHCYCCCERQLLMAIAELCRSFKKTKTNWIYFSQTPELVSSFFCQLAPCRSILVSWTTSKVEWELRLRAAKEKKKNGIPPEISFPVVLALEVCCTVEVDVEWTFAILSKYICILTSHQLLFTLFL